MRLNTLKTKSLLVNTALVFKIIVPLQLAFLILFTLTAFGAQQHMGGSIPSQETIDTVQDMKLYALESKMQTNTSMVDNLNNQFGLMRSSMDRFTGIGIGLGCALTMLQALQLILNLKLNTRKTVTVKE